MSIIVNKGMKNYVLILGIVFILGAGLKSCVVEYECNKYNVFVGSSGKEYVCKIKKE